MQLSLDSETKELLFYEVFMQNSTQTNQLLVNKKKTLEFCTTETNQLVAYMGCPESFRTFNIARHCVDLAGRGKCYSLVMSLCRNASRKPHCPILLSHCAVLLYVITCLARLAILSRQENECFSRATNLCEILYENLKICY